MLNLHIIPPGMFGRVVGVLLGLPLLVPTLNASAFAQAPGGPAASAASSASVQAPSPDIVKSWRKGMKQIPLPHEGCFTSSYPNTQWQEVPCRKPPAVPFLPARGPRPATVGNGNDVSVEVSGHISTSVGSFQSVSGVTSETGIDPNTGSTAANVYTLQLNSNFFSGSPACSGAAVPASCQAWEQFVYESDEFPGAFIQYWLINYSTTCPQNWNAFGSDCYTNSTNEVSVPQQPISNLINLSVTAEAVSGGMDTLIMSTGSTLYAMQQTDSTVSLAGGWQISEFNIVGDGNGTEATFNGTPSIVVRTSAASGTSAAPACYAGGFTGETNNLSFATAPTAIRGTTPALMFSQTSSGTNSACGSATEVASGALVDTHDFNADGTSDILWRQNGTGELAMWLMSDGHMSSGATISQVSTTWTVRGTRDFNGDGKADILWLDNAGDLAIWLMNGPSEISGISLGNIGAQWSVAGTGDFNGDGVGDILWRNTSTGDVAIWFMNGNGQFSSGADLGVVAINTWSIVGVGDFNGDGKSDILWKDTSGDVGVWLMNGSTVQSTTGLGNVGTAWSVVGTGDFNGNGTSDILWRDNSGNLAIWLMSNGQFSSGATLGQVPTAWSVAETGDFNGDGKSDIMWLCTTGGGSCSVGDLAVWLMNGTSLSSGIGLGNVGSTWLVQGNNAD